MKKSFKTGLSAPHLSSRAATDGNRKNDDFTPAALFPAA
jgi:hypothetical protein